jgi:hypothetical protein
MHDVTSSHGAARTLPVAGTKINRSIPLIPSLRSFLYAAAFVSVYIGLVFLVRLSLPAVTQYLTRLKYGGL